MACVSAPKKFAYQTPSTASTTGMFFSSRAARKCSSMACAPASSSRKRSGPMATMSESPMADHIE